MKNKMKATGQSYDEVVDDFFNHTEELKGIGYKVIDEKTDEIVENKSYYRKLLGGTEEDFEELIETALHMGNYHSGYKQNHLFLMNDEVIKWADGDIWADAFEKVHKAKEIDPNYQTGWTPNPKTDLFGDVEDGEGFIDTPRIEEWLE